MAEVSPLWLPSPPTFPWLPRPGLPVEVLPPATGVMLSSLRPPMVRRLLVMTLLACAKGDKPAIIDVNTDDPDNADRVFSTGDTITLLVAPVVTTTGRFARSRQIAGVTTNGVGTVLDKAGIDALFNFSVSIGTSYHGQWERLGSNFLQQLTITVNDTTGADVASLASNDFRVACNPEGGGLQLASPVAGDAPCDTTFQAPQPLDTINNWGEGRPSITTVRSNSTNASLLLSSGDTVQIDFDAAVDTAAIIAYANTNSLTGAAYVSSAPAHPPAAPRLPPLG